MATPRTEVRNASARAREVIDRCRALAQFTDEPGFTTRTFLSTPMRGVHAEVTSWMKALSMDVSVDAAGNIRGVHAADHPDAPRLFLGSHLDTVPRAGAFDGILGVVMAVATVDMLEGQRLPFAIEVIGFSEEEGVRFGVPFIGSRALSGSIDDDLLNRKDADGIRVRDAIVDFGLDVSAIQSAQAEPGALGYLEFHIEQGPVLERLGLPLAIVDTIVGQSRVEVTFAGAANHAGTTPMLGRRDAMAGAAEWIVAVEREALATPGLVATVGRVIATPGATNIIAGSCRASLDVRHPSDAARHAAASRLMAAAHEIAGRRSLSAEWKTHIDQPSVGMNEGLIELLTRAVTRCGLPRHRMPSGAGHDAMIVAARMPAAMLFVRSPDGLSHHPDESVIEDDVAAALAVGREFILELAESVRD